MRLLSYCLTALGLFCIAIGGSACPKQATPSAVAAADIPYPELAATTDTQDVTMLHGYFDAPEFPTGVHWYNTGRPLTMAELKGKVVLLDFWTHCCINCMHILPDLHRLEEEFPNELVVVGVHSAKFDAERSDTNIYNAILRYEIAHPVFNDDHMRYWRALEINAWPTLVLINPAGRVVGRHSGEGVYEPFSRAIRAVIEEYDRQGQLDRTPLMLKREAPPDSTLAYPGKLASDEQHQLLAVSDSNHNRILLTGLDGAVQQVIGGTEAGFTDGVFSAARFFRPQGVCFDAKGQLLFIADTENHAVRVADLRQGTVETLAGNGAQAFGYERGMRGRELGLSSPWDVVLADGTLYVAMAGTHQLWALDPQTGEGRVHAGSGMENIVDGRLAQAALAQPSGITTDGKLLYFADSEVSAVRSAGLGSDGMVASLAGVGLFDFGDQDGDYPRSRLQHPLGVAWHDGAVYVADTYNNKIKRLDPATRTLTSLLGSSKPGARDGTATEAEFYQPSGLCWAAGRLYIADTNNHALRVYDPQSGKVSTLALTFSAGK